MSIKVEQKWGFGMAPIKPGIQEKRKISVRNVLDIVVNKMIDEKHIDSLSEVKGLFSRVYKQDQWDWFTVFEQLGCPGRVKSKRVASNISKLREIFIGKIDQDICEVFQNLNDLDIKRHLENFLNQKKNTKESHKIYILSTREQKKFLNIGCTRRSVVDLVNEINSATGVVVPFGVRAVWSVKDARQIKSKIHQKLSDYRVRSDREFFMMDYRDAFRIINRILKEGRIKEL